MAGILSQLSDGMASVVAKVKPALVQITGPEDSIGAGTIWHSDGLVVTNAHVVIDRRFGERKPLNVVLDDGRSYPAKLLATDTTHDVAALAIDAEDLPTIELADNGRLKPGQWVMALGHPWGVLNALTAGIVIGQGANLPEVAGREWVALSLQLRPGHSGGPLVDVHGRLVGINTMIAGPQVGFAVPLPVVKRFLKEALGSPQTTEPDIVPETITL